MVVKTVFALITHFSNRESKTWKEQVNVIFFYAHRTHIYVRGVPYFPGRALGLDENKQTDLKKIKILFVYLFYDMMVLVESQTQKEQNKYRIVCLTLSGIENTAAEPSRRQRMRRVKFQLPGKFKF